MGRTSFLCKQTKQDKLFIVLATHRMGWSARRIGRLLGHSTSNITALITNALYKFNNNELDISPTYEAKGEVYCNYIGGSNEIEAIERIQLERAGGKIRH